MSRPPRGALDTNTGLSALLFGQGRLAILGHRHREVFLKTLGA